jgi:hypothetical protein
MVFSAHLKTKTPRRLNIRVIMVRENTKTIPRALSGSFYTKIDYFTWRVGTYQFLNRSKIVLFHDCRRQWHTLQVNFPGQYQVVPALRHRGLREIQEIFDLALLLVSRLEPHFLELSLSVLLSLGCYVLKSLVSMDFHLVLNWIFWGLSFSLSIEF